MGGSVSSNSVKLVINAVAKISSKIVQDTHISYDARQVIFIKDTKGDVVIRGNKMIQNAYVNMQALFNAMSSESAQQNLALELAQSAKALTSGLNLGQYSQASNDLDIFVQTSIELTTEISQYCAEMVKQEQVIRIEHTIGSVIIENNLFEQVATLFENCLQTSISNSEALQAIILKLTQDSSATSQGISEWAIVAIMALVIGAPTVGAIAIGKDILKFLFPIMLIAGVVMLIIYYATKKQVMVMKAYSTFIENAPGCLAAPYHPKPSLEFGSAEAAGNNCNNSQDCVAFDWKGLNVTDTGSWTLTNPPETRFFTSVSSDCRSDVTNDNVNTLRAPVIFSGLNPPPSSLPGVIKGDCWIDTTTSKWYQLVLNWNSKDSIVKDPFSKLTIQKQAPSTQPGVSGEFVISYTEDTPDYFYVFAYDAPSQKWINHDTVPGPGLFAYSPPVINGSGFKEKSGTDWLFYGGIAASIVGLGGTILNMFAPNRDQQNQPRR